MTKQAQRYICKAAGCNSKLSSKRCLEIHMNNYHNHSNEIKYTDCNGSETRHTLIRTEAGVKCPSCSQYFKAVSGVRNHLVNTKGKCLPEQSLSDNHEDVDNESAHFTPLPSVPTYSESDPEPATSFTYRNHSQAIIYSCQSMESSADEQAKNEYILDKVHIEPFTLIDKSDPRRPAYHNALAHRDVVGKMAGKLFECQPILPSKRKAEDLTNTTMLSPLCNILHGSHYRELLRVRDFFELNQDVTDMLNEDWQHMPQMKYACAQVLAGSILVNALNGQATFVNTCEVNGRDRLVDIHREHAPGDRSCEPPPNTIYENVWVCTTAYGDNGAKKLNIASQSMNALVTSTIRLDVKEEIHVGPSFSGSIGTATRIFIDKGSYQKARALAENPQCRRIECFNLTTQLRQLRSQYHHVSTYYLTRASSFLAVTAKCHPASVFTYCLYENGVTKGDPNESASRVSSRLFNDIAYQVISRGFEATLSKQQVASCIERCPPGKIHDILESVLSLFVEDNVVTPILNNQELNQKLTSLAALLSSDIAKLNKSKVSTNIQSRIDQLNN